MQSLVAGRKRIVVFDGILQLSEDFAGRFRALNRRCRQEKGVFTAALAGGKSMERHYRQLAQEMPAPEWESVHLFMADERQVPRNAPESNYRLIGDTLLRSIRLPCNNLHAIPVEETAQESAAAYEEELRRSFGLKERELPRFDLIVLGIGIEGHTASLFPGESALNEHRHFAVAARGPAPGDERVTLTLDVVNNARNVFFLVTGKEKAAIIKEVTEKGTYRVPAAMVEPEENPPVFLLDREAASML